MDRSGESKDVSARRPSRVVHERESAIADTDSLIVGDRASSLHCVFRELDDLFPLYVVLIAFCFDSVLDFDGRKRRIDCNFARNQKFQRASGLKMNRNVFARMDDLIDSRDRGDCFS